MNCCVCQQPSGRQEICRGCAPMLSPHHAGDIGVKRSSRKVMVVPAPAVCGAR